MLREELTDEDVDWLNWHLDVAECDEFRFANKLPTPPPYVVYDAG